MQFDGGITNPPYKGQSMLHQQFFNKMVNELIKDGGQVVCLQPATVYFNKKEKTDKHSQQMRDNIKNYETKVEFVDPKLFDSAIIMNDLSITTLTKIPTNTSTLSEVKFNNVTYNDVELEDISRTGIDPDIFCSIKKKYDSFIDKNGCLLDICSSDPEIQKLEIKSLRGNYGLALDDWYTVIPKEKKFWKPGNGFGIPIDNNFDIITNFITSNPIRFGLAIYKFSKDMHGGAMNGIPLVDLDKMYTDVELYNMIGLSVNEQNVIDNFLSNYYGRN